MRYKRIRSIIMAGVLGMLNVLFAYSQPADSLGYYLELAARNNPQINADFSLYKASLEKVPQAGAYPDPELEIGFFLKPMEILSGKQIADFTLMQMFPWFGTRKAARNEATEMARMAYEQFRNSRNNLYYEVKSQWYQLCNISEQYKKYAGEPSSARPVGTVGIEPLLRSVGEGGRFLRLTLPRIFCSIDSSRRIRWRYVGYGRQ